MDAPHGPNAVGFVSKRSDDLQNARLVARRARRNVDLHAATRHVRRLDQQQIRNAVAVVIGHHPSTVGFVAESGGAFEDARLIPGSAGGDVDLHMPAGCVRRLDEDEIGNAVPILVGHGPSAIGFIAECRYTVEKAHAVVRTADVPAVGTSSARPSNCGRAATQRGCRLVRLAIR